MRFECSRQTDDSVDRSTSRGKSWQIRLPGNHSMSTKRLVSLSKNLALDYDEQVANLVSSVTDKMHMVTSILTALCFIPYRTQTLYFKQTLD